MTTHLNITIAEADAKLRKVSHEVQKGTAGTITLEREWIEIAAETAKTLLDTMASTTVVSPKADGQSFTGTYQVGENRIEGDDSRAVTIVQVLVLNDASGITSTYAETCDIDVTITRYFDQSKAQYDTIWATFANPTNGTTVSISAPVVNQLGLIDFTVTQRVRQLRQYPTDPTGIFSTGAILTETAFEESRRWIQKGLNAEGSAAVARRDTTTRVDGYVKTQRVDPNDDCTKDAETVEREATAVGTTGEQKTIDLFETVDETNARNQTTAVTPESAQTTGTVVTTRADKNEFGRFDNRTTTRTATAISAATATKQIDTFKTATDDVARNQTAAVTPETIQTPGQIVRSRADKNDFGRFDNSTTTTVATAVPNADRTKTIDLFKSEATDVSRNASTAVAQETSQTAGQVVTTDSRTNEFGRFDNTTKTETAILATGAVAEKSIETFRTVVGSVDRNQTLAVTQQTSQTDGTIKKTTADVNAFGRYDNRTDTTTATAVTNADQSKTIKAFDTLTVDTSRNQTTAVTQESAQAAGTIVTTDGSKNAFGRFDNTTRTSTSTAASAATAEKTIELFRTRTSSVDRNQVSAVTQESTQTTGQIKTTHSDKNDFGRYDNKTDTIVAATITGSVATKEIKTFETDVVAAARNQTAAVTEEVSQTAGTIVRTHAEKNDFGRFDNSTTTRTATAVTSAVEQKTIGTHTTDTVSAQRHEVLAVTAQVSQTAGTLVTTRSEKDDFGRFDNQTTTRTATAISDADKLKRIEKYETLTDVGNTHQTTAVAEEVSQVPGTIVTTKSDKDDFGRFTNRTNTRTATAVGSGDVEYTRTTGTTRTVTTNEHQTAASGVPATTVGSTSITRDTQDEFGRFRQVIDVAVHNDLTVGPFTSEKTRTVTETRTVIRDQAAEPTLTASYGSLRYSKNDHGRYDGDMVSRVYLNSDGDIPLSYGSGTDKTYDIVEKQPWPVTQGYRWRVKRVTYDYGHTRSYNTGQTNITGGFKGSYSHEIKGPNLFRWVKLKSVAIIGVWQYTDIAFTAGGTPP